jgi:glycine dehydrogenase subunit 1
LEDLARVNFENGHKLAKAIMSIDGFEKMFSAVHFNEFVIKCPKDAKLVNKKLLKENIQGGLVLDGWYPSLKNCMLFGITEIHSNDDIERLTSLLKEVL